MLSEVRTDLGIRVSDALLRGGGNCALLVEGRCEEDGFPIFMSMCGLSEFRMGLNIVNMDGSNLDKPRTITKLLSAYEIPCVVVLDKDAEKTADDLKRMQGNELPNLKRVFCLRNGAIEDYYPLEIVARVMNEEMSPANPIDPEEFDANLSGEQKLKNFGKVMHEHGCGSSTRYLKTLLGSVGSRMMQDDDLQIGRRID